jgi:hypothetical protein
MFHSIVSGLMASRKVDKYRSGQFNASRDRGSRWHQGLDVSARAGVAVYSPIRRRNPFAEVHRCPKYLSGSRCWRPTSTVTL